MLSRFIILVVSAVALAGTASAQSADVRVERAPAPMPSNRAPEYPRALLEDTSRTPTAGRVIVEFLVRANGAIDLTTVEVISSSDTAFVAPVLAVLPKWRFLPGEVGPDAYGRFTVVDMRIRVPVTIAPPPQRRRRR